MSDKTLVKNIKIIKNNTRYVDDTFFPNINYMEQELFTFGTKENKYRHTKLSSRIPIIRGGDVYLVLLVLRYQDSAELPNRKKDYINQFLQEANVLQQRYIVQDNLIGVDGFVPDLMLYKMEY